MATPLTTLRENARDRADQDANSNIVGNTELDRYLQQGYERLYGLITENGQVDNYLENVEFALTGGTAEYTPTTSDGIYKVVGVDIKYSNEFRKIRSLSFRGRTIFNTQSSWTRYGRVYYKLTGRDSSGNQRITFYPTPDSANTARIWYLPFPGAVESDSYIDRTFYLDYIEVYAARKMCAKEDEWDKHAALTEEMRSLEIDIKWETATGNNADPDSIISNDYEDFPWYDSFR